MQPDIHETFENPNFKQAVARLLIRYTNKYTEVGKKTTDNNQLFAPQALMTAFNQGLCTMAERVAPPVNYTTTNRYYGMFSKDHVFGANYDASAANGCAPLKLIQSIHHRLQRRPSDGHFSVLCMLMSLCYS